MNCNVYVNKKIKAQYDLLAKYDRGEKFGVVELGEAFECGSVVEKLISTQGEVDGQLNMAIFEIAGRTLLFAWQSNGGVYPSAWKIYQPIEVTKREGVVTEWIPVREVQA